MWEASSAAAAVKAPAVLPKDEITSCGIVCRCGRRHQRRRDQVRETMTAAIEFSAEGFLQQVNEYECIGDLGFGAMTEVSSFRLITGLCLTLLRVVGESLETNSWLVIPQARFGYRQGGVEISRFSKGLLQNFVRLPFVKPCLHTAHRTPPGEASG